MLTRARIAVLVSGGGTNLQALLDAQRDGKMPHGDAGACQHSATFSSPDTISPMTPAS